MQPQACSNTTAVKTFNTFVVRIDKSFNEDNLPLQLAELLDRSTKAGPSTRKDVEGVQVHVDDGFVVIANTALIVPLYVTLENPVIKHCTIEELPKDLTLIGKLKEDDKMVVFYMKTVSYYFYPRYYKKLKG